MRKTSAVNTVHLNVLRLHSLPRAPSFAFEFGLARHVATSSILVISSIEYAIFHLFSCTAVPILGIL